VACRRRLYRGPILIVSGPILPMGEPEARGHWVVSATIGAGSGDVHGSEVPQSDEIVYQRGPGGSSRLGLHFSGGRVGFLPDVAFLGDRRTSTSRWFLGSSPPGDAAPAGDGGRVVLPVRPARGVS